MKAFTNRLVVAAVAALVLLSPAGAGAQNLDPDAVAEPEMTPRLSRGQLNYQAYCAECHGKKGVGTDKGPPFLHRVYHPGHHGDESFVRATRQGAQAHHWNFGNMKPVEGVTDAQLQSVIDYVRALQKANGIF